MAAAARNLAWPLITLEANMTIEEMFEKTVKERLDEAEKITGHNFYKLRELIRLHTAVGAARILLSPSSPGSFPCGFKVLAEWDLLSKSIEQATLDFGNTGLFDEGQLSRARSQLVIAQTIRLGKKARK
jgi:hypothetical protein